MLKPNRIKSLLLSIVSAGFILVAFASTASAQASSGPMCSVVAPDRCYIETFDGASGGTKGTSWTSPNGWDFDVFNSSGTDISVDTGYADFGTAVQIGCNTTKIELPDDDIRYVTFLINGDSSTSGWMDILAVDNNGDIVDQTYRYNLASHGAETVYLGPVSGNNPALDKIVIHTIEDPDVVCDFQCSAIDIGEIRACGRPRIN